MINDVSDTSVFIVQGVYLSETLQSLPNSNGMLFLNDLSNFISTASIKGLQGICTSNNNNCRSY